MIPALGTETLIKKYSQTKGKKPIDLFKTLLMCYSLMKKKLVYS